MQQYVLGIIFNDTLNKVLLIHKNRSPDGVNLTGKLNGIGGKIEENELPLDAMIREGLEETNLDVTLWYNFANLKTKYGIIYCFVATANINEYKQLESEKLEIFDLFSHSYFSMSRVPNLDYLISMARNNYLGLDSAKKLEIIEHYD